MSSSGSRTNTHPQITQIYTDDKGYFSPIGLLIFVLCLPNLTPRHKLDIIFLELLTKGITGKEVEIALSPRGSPIRMIYGRCSHFLVIISNVDDHFSYARLHCLHCIGVELRPTVSLNAGNYGDHFVQQDVVRSKYRG